MEKLQLRSDGIYETASGKFAVKPLRVTGQSSDHKWFQYKSEPFADPTRVVWLVDDELIVIDSDIAAFMVRMRYARNAMEAEAERWNQRVAELEAQNPLDQQEPAQEPASTQTATAATTPAEGVETAQEGQDNGNSGTVASEAATTAQQLGEPTPADEKPAEEQSSESGQQEETPADQSEGSQETGSQSETDDEASKDGAEETQKKSRKGKSGTTGIL
jgi:hypothetical protein